MIRRYDSGSDGRSSFLTNVQSALYRNSLKKNLIHDRIDSPTAYLRLTVLVIRGQLSAVLLQIKMTLYLTITILALTLGIILEWLKPVDRQWHLFRGRRCKLPPGPRGLPVVGNMLQLFRARDSGQLAPYVSLFRSSHQLTTSCGS